MQPSAEDEALRRARRALRGILAGLHVLDALPERSRMLAVDAEIPVHSVLETVLSEQHPQLHPRPVHPHPSASTPGASGDGPAAPMPHTPTMLRREAPGMVSAAAEEPAPLLSCGLVSPALPSNVLAEVCEFDSATLEAAPTAAADEAGEDKQPAVRRGWTSPDDGWGTHLPIPMQDLEKMPMGMPLTVGELAEFLAQACQESTEASAAGGDMLEWSLAQWRAYRAKLSGQAPGQPKPEAAKAPEADAEGAEGAEPSSRLYIEERPMAAGPVLVHQVPLAPPRPILCADDPEASLLKAVELLLAYPELDALPIVSPVRCTVVAHLTLGYCLAYALGRLRGADLEPLANLVVTPTTGLDGGSTAAPRKFDTGAGTELGRESCWAERRQAPQAPWVLGRSQPVRDLLAFFSRTHHSGVPVVEDSTNMGVLGLLTRRDLLHFLDLAMQSARRRLAGQGPADSPECSVVFDLSVPVQAMLDTVRRFRARPPEEANAGVGGLLPSTRSPLGEKVGLGAGLLSEKTATNPGVGAALLFDKEVTLKSLLGRVLVAENRKLLFVQDAGGGPPKLLRIVSVSDVWQLLLGPLKDLADLPEEPLRAQDL